MRLFFAIALASISHVLGHKKGAVASEVATCSRIGVDLINKGGNAADAVSGLPQIFTLLIFLVGRHCFLCRSDW